jgi:hypothetical protein
LSILNVVKILEGVSVGKNVDRTPLTSTSKRYVHIKYQPEEEDEYIDL